MKADDTQRLATDLNSMVSNRCYVPSLLLVVPLARLGGWRWWLVRARPMLLRQCRSPALWCYSAWLRLA